MFGLLFSRFLGLLLTIALTWASGSVWVLVVGQLASALIRLALMTLGLPGPRNCFRLEWGAVAELLPFGKWIFVSTLASFIISQGGPVILGSFPGLDMLGIHTIGQTLAALPLMVGSALVGRLVLPLYRDHPPAESPRNFAALTLHPQQRTAGAGRGTCPVVRRPDAPADHDQLRPDCPIHRRFTKFFADCGPRRLSLLCVGLGAAMASSIGGIAGQGLAAVPPYPLVARLARRYGAWDACHDLIMGLAFSRVAVLAI